MEPTTFFENYRICTSEAGREVSRTGAAINYKAIDTRSGDPVVTCGSAPWRCAWTDEKPACSAIKLITAIFNE